MRRYCQLAGGGGIVCRHAHSLLDRAINQATILSYVYIEQPIPEFVCGQKILSSLTKCYLKLTTSTHFLALRHDFNLWPFWPKVIITPDIGVTQAHRVYQIFRSRLRSCGKPYIHTQLGGWSHRRYSRGVPQRGKLCVKMSHQCDRVCIPPSALLIKEFVCTWGLFDPAVRQATIESVLIGTMSHASMTL